MTVDEAFKDTGSLKLPQHLQQQRGRNGVTIPHNAHTKEGCGDSRHVTLNRLYCHAKQKVALVMFSIY